MRIDIDTNDSKMQATMNACMMLFTTQRIHSDMAHSAGKLTVDHLKAVSASRDHESHFYELYADNVSVEADEQEGRVIIPPIHNKTSSKQSGNSLAAHFFGADIFPTSGHKYLTIPIKEARGMRAFDFPGKLEPAFGRRKDGTIGVVGLKKVDGEKLPTKGMTRKMRSRLNKALRHSVMNKLQQIVFWLVKSSHLNPDPTVLPTVQQYSGRVRESLIDSINAELKNKGIV